MTAEIGRSYILMQPSIGVTFNGGLIIFLHGATGSAQQVVTDTVTQEFLRALTQRGFMLLIPNARSDFAMGQTYYPRWESETANNLDVQFVQYAMNVLVSDYNELNKEKIKNVFICGGSSGGFMTTRLATDITSGIKGIAMINGGFWSQASISNNTLALNNNRITVRSGFPPTLMVSSTVDAIVPIQYKAVCHQALVDAGVDCTNIVDSYGQHEWGDWVRQYNSQIQQWFIDKNTA